MKRTPVFSANDFSAAWNYQVRQACAETSNAKLDKLIESWPVVYLRESGISWSTEVEPCSLKHKCHSARLAFIEELKPKVCEHDGAPQFISKSSTQLDGYTYPVFAESYKCRKCGARLKATWSVAE